MNYYKEIKQELIKNEINRSVKKYAINQSDLNTYYNVGKLLSEAGKHYGDGIVKEYSKRLTNELGKGYSIRNMWLMLKFFILKEKVQTLSAQLTWSHYVELLPIDNIDKIKYYINFVEKHNLSVRQLRERTKSNEYERLPDDTKNKLINSDENLGIVDLIKEPIVIKSNSDYEYLTEKALQQIILENIPKFLNELGDGYSFIGNEY